MRSPFIAAGEERVFAIESNGPDRSLDRVGVDLDPAVVEEAREPLPVVPPVADCLGHLGFCRDELELLREPRSELSDKRLSSGLANGATQIGALPSYLRFNAIERGDARERLVCDWRGAALGHFIETPSQMRPAEGERNLAPRPGSASDR